MLLLLRIKPWARRGLQKHLQLARPSAPTRRRTSYETSSHPCDHVTITPASPDYSLCLEQVISVEMSLEPPRSVHGMSIAWIYVNFLNGNFILRPPFTNKYALLTDFIAFLFWIWISHACYSNCHFNVCMQYISVKTRNHYSHSILIRFDINTKTVIQIYHNVFYFFIKKKHKIM